MICNKLKEYNFKNNLTFIKYQIINQYDNNITEILNLVCKEANKYRDNFGTYIEFCVGLDIVLLYNKGICYMISNKINVEEECKNILYKWEYKLIKDYKNNTHKISEIMQLNNNLMNIKRYIELLTMYEVTPKRCNRGSVELEHLMWMLNYMFDEKNSYKFDLYKLCNWIGYIQGALVSKNIIDAKYEKDFMNILEYIC